MALTVIRPRVFIIYLRQQEGLIHHFKIDLKPADKNPLTSYHNNSDYLINRSHSFIFSAVY